jgi:hypothetical protein
MRIFYPTSRIPDTKKKSIDLWAQSNARMAWKQTPGQRYAKKMIKKSSKQTNIWSTYLTKDPDEVGSGVVNQTLPPEKTPTQTRDI